MKNLSARKVKQLSLKIENLPLLTVHWYNTDNMQKLSRQQLLRCKSQKRDISATITKN